MELDWYCTRTFYMRQPKLLRGSMVFQKATSLMKRQRNRQNVIWCLTTSIWANRVAIVSSVITNIINPCKHSMVMVLYVQWISVYSYLLPVFSVIAHQYCLIRFVRLFSVRLFVYSTLFSVLKLILYSRYFDPHINNHLSGKSINITHLTPPSFV